MNEFACPQCMADSEEHPERCRHWCHDHVEAFKTAKTLMITLEQRKARRP